MSQKDLTISEMQKMQQELQEANKDKWGETKPEEYSNAYIEKHNYNMNRNYAKDNAKKYNKKTF